MEDRHYILSDVARILGKKPHQVTYALTSRAVPEPEQRVASRRLFSRDEIVLSLATSRWHRSGRYSKSLVRTQSRKHHMPWS